MQNFTFVILLICLFRHARGRVSHFDPLIRLPTIKTISVLDFGAIGDGISDDTEAFNNAWREICSSSRDVVLEMPRDRVYLVKPLSFSGPCNSQINVEISGLIISSNKTSNYLIRFDGLDSLMIQGGGTIDGRENIGNQDSCINSITNPCKNASTVLLFYNCNNLNVNNLKIQGSQKIHVVFDHCSGVKASNLTVMAPETSSNSDGIYIRDTLNIQISHCTISTGEECIFVSKDSEEVRATNITCGPGHGVRSMNSVIHFTDVFINRGDDTNGVKIKTWEGGNHKLHASI